MTTSGEITALRPDIVMPIDHYKLHTFGGALNALALFITYAAAPFFMPCIVTVFKFLLRTGYTDKMMDTTGIQVCFFHRYVQYMYLGQLERIRFK